MRGEYDAKAANEAHMYVDTEPSMDYARGQYLQF